MSGTPAASAAARPSVPAQQATGVRSSGSSPAVLNAFRLLDVLVQRPGGGRLSDLAREVGMPKSTALRILATMRRVGVVRYDAAAGTYQVGARLLEYAKAPLNLEADMVREFYRVAGPLHAEFDETIQLAVLSAPDVTFIARIDTTRAVRLVTQVGRRLPAHATAVGKVILAFSEADEVDSLISAGLPSLTPNTITDPEAFRRELGQARRNGYATESEESSANLSCLSAPVFGSDGVVRAGMTMCVPVSKISPDRVAVLSEAVRAGARALSAAL
jgi:DNA-binding IclR family transcriptional regulator